SGRTTMDLPRAPLPRMARVRQQLPDEHLPDVAEAVRGALAQGGLAERIRPGQRVAITAGSRGIRDLPAVLAAAVAAVREAGGDPFIAPCMGSHGGATADGQREVLAAYGFPDGWEGCAVRSSMDVVPVAGDHDLPVPIVTDAHAAAAAATIEIPHDLVHARAHEMWERIERQLASRGIDPQAYAQMQGKSRHDLIDDAEEDAERTLRREAVLAAVVEAEGIEAGEDEVLESLERAAAAEGGSPKKLLERLRSSGRLDSLKADLAQRKAIDRIAESAKPISVAQAQARDKLWTPGGDEPEKAAASGLWTPGS
ncbi:MAG: hypothetical protein ACRDNN_17460, partial [Gaiellaceae bacterium]